MGEKRRGRKKKKGERATNYEEEDEIRKREKDFKFGMEKRSEKFFFNEEQDAERAKHYSECDTWPRDLILK